ncbi:response regulator [Zobellella sp. DQSA1]|uniref:response regulator n=1 Tax=Zobellella sp. DQSA1 TaxID=3342386 RepID=UPI0035C1810B
MSEWAGRHILVVDDDEEICALLKSYLERSGFKVSSLNSGERLLQALELVSPDMLILDVMMPGEDGFTLCSRVRKVSQVPIIMLTASADESDRIIGLELGADDYVPKPFSPRELLARIKAIFRRVGGVMPGGHHRYYCFAGWQLDTVNRSLTNPQGEEHALSGADYTLLQLFLERPGEVLSRDDLLGLTRGREANPFDRSIDVQLSRLRQRLGEDAKDPHIIKTVRGAGYVLAVAVELK